MSILVTEVLDYLEDLGLIRGSTGWEAFAGYLPPDPDRVIVVFETPGGEPDMKPLGSDEIEYDRPGFQIRGRGGEYDYEALREKMGEIFRALVGTDMKPVNSNYVLVTPVQSAPLPLGLDDSSRPGMTWNYVAMREREAA